MKANLLNRMFYCWPLVLVAIRCHVAFMKSAVFFVVFVLSCSSKQESVTPPMDSKEPGDAAAVSCGSYERVSLETSDGVELVADYHPPSKPGMGAVVLVHMIPPNFDRSSYPERVRLALIESGIALINLDRRGAGESSGVAQEAYQGPNGQLDVQAAVQFITSSDRACKSLDSNIMLVGASNGTTSVFDFVVARASSNLPSIKSVVWLSPGTYTENQNTVASNETLLKATPTLVIHPDSEPWATQYATFSPNWKIVELVDGKHGTNNFDQGAHETKQVNEIKSWISQYLAN